YPPPGHLVSPYTQLPASEPSGHATISPESLLEGEARRSTDCAATVSAQLGRCKARLRCLSHGIGDLSRRNLTTRNGSSLKSSVALSSVPSAPPRARGVSSVCVRMPGGERPQC